MYKPTKRMAEIAEKALEWREEFGRGGTSVGVARARDIKNRKNLSLDTVKRMVSYFARHEVDKEAEGFKRGEKGYPSAGKIAWCLHGDSLVLMADGRQIPIKTIVENRMTDNVVCIDKNGNITEAPIINWFVNNSNMSEFRRVSVDKVQRYNVANKTYVDATLEHEFLTSDGWVATENLDIGTDSLTQVAYYIHPSIEQVLIATYLSDGSLEFTDTTKNSSRISWNHSVEDIAWGDYKAEILSPIMTSQRTYSTPISGYSAGKRQPRWRTISSPLHNQMLDVKYDDNKAVTLNLLNRITSLGLAIIIGDDGCLHVDRRDGSYSYRLHWENFTESEIDLTVKWLRDKMLVGANTNDRGSVYKVKRSNTNGYAIYITGCFAKELAKQIAPFIPKVMWRKVPEDMRVDAKPVTIPKTIKTYTLPVMKIGKINKSLGHSLKYDITVQGHHNYVANGFVVHNCLWGGDQGRTWAKAIVEREEKKAKLVASIHELEQQIEKMIL